MQKLVTVLVIVLAAAIAQAGTIMDIQQGLVEENTLVTATDVVVTAAAGNGVFLTELPVGPYAGIWCYLGNDHGIMAGDVVTVTGIYKEYYDLSEIDVPGAGEDGSIVVTAQGDVPTPYSLTAAEYLADPEVFEGVSICITDGMQVVDVPNQYGEWYAMVLDTDLQIMFDDLFYDDTTVMAGQCYDYACGAVYFSFGEYKLEAYADGIAVVDCTVPVESNTLTGIKGLFR